MFLKKITYLIKSSKLAYLIKPAKISRQFSTTLLQFNKETEYEDFVAQLPTFAGGDIHMNLNDETGVCVLTVDNPRSKNALTGSMVVKLNEITNQLQNWDEGKTVILCGSDAQFCSGGDLKYFMNEMNTPRLGGFMCKYMQDLMMRFTNLPLITVAAVQGKALGGGAELITGCDYRIMQENAEIAFVQTGRGITTGFGGTSRLVKLIGPSQAMKLLLSAQKLNAEDAMEIGLVDYIFPQDADCVNWCTDWLHERKLLNINAKLLQNVKEMTTAASNLPIEESYNFERMVFERFWQGKLHKESHAKNLKYR